MMRPSRLIPLAAALTLAVGAGAALAAPPQPSFGTANVDGNAAEWNLGTDFFSNMIRAGGNGGQTKVESKLYLRYDCATHVMYALVQAEPGVTIASDAAHAGDNFVKLGVKKQVDASFGDDGVAPDFAYIGSNGTTASGWEASFPLAEGTYTDLNVHTAVNDGGGQTSAVPGRAITVTIACGEVPPSLPLTVSKTATATYARTFNWTIAKEATPATVTTGANTADFTYKVTVTKSAPIDSGFTVAGTVTVGNPNDFQVSGVDVVDELAGTPCPLTNATNLTIPAGGSVGIDYSCALPAKTDGVNQATATWPGGSASGSAPYAFGAPSSVTNDSVDVTDALGAEAAAALAGGTGLTTSKVFTYTRTLPVPATGCTSYVNTATITASPQTPSTANLPQSASATVQACREIVIVGTPSSKLRVTKRGPASAKSGSVITFTISVKNTSTTTATAVVLNDVLPVGYSVAQLPKGASFKKGKVVWNVGDLAPGATKTVKLRARIDANTGGRRCNTATASAGNAPTVSAKACTRVVRVAGVVIVPAVTG